MLSKRQKIWLKAYFLFFIFRFRFTSPRLRELMWTVDLCWLWAFEQLPFMIHMKVKPFLHVNHNVWFLFIVVFLNESRETAWEMYLPLLCHWGWKRRHEWTQDLYFCANNSKKWGPELVKRGPERTQDLYFGLYSEKGRSWVCEKSSWGSLTF